MSFFSSDMMNLIYPLLVDTRLKRTIISITKLCLFIVENFVWLFIKPTHAVKKNK